MICYSIHLCLNAEEHYGHCTCTHCMDGVLRWYNYVILLHFYLQNVFIIHFLCSFGLITAMCVNLSKFLSLYVAVNEFDWYLIQYRYITNKPVKPDYLISCGQLITTGQLLLLTTILMLNLRWRTTPRSQFYTDRKSFYCHFYPLVWRDKNNSTKPKYGSTGKVYTE